MITLPIETKERGMPVADLYAQLRNQLAQMTGANLSSEAMEVEIATRLLAWQQKDLIVVRQVMGKDGQINHLVWKRDPAIVALERKNAKIEQVLESDWLKAAQMEGGLIEAIFADIDSPKTYPSRFGKAIH